MQFFGGFTSNVNWIAHLTFSIRNSFKHQFSNLIEVFRSKDASFCKFIYPDKGTKIIVKGVDGIQIEYEMVPETSFYDYGIEIYWNASIIIPTSDELERLKVLSKYYEKPRVAH